MRNNDFLNVPQIPVETSLGSIDFPMLYSEVDGLFASFWVDYDLARKKLSETGLKPARKPFSLTRKTVMTIAFFEYRKCSGGPYNEVAVAIHSYPEAMGDDVKFSLFDMLKKPDKRKVGTFILDLPVTTDWAMAGGVEIYGYPKWVADIALHFGKNVFKGQVIDPANGEPVLSLSGEYKGPGIKTPSMDIMSYSFLNHQMLKTSIHTDGNIKTYSGRKFILKSGDSNHGSSVLIRELGLDGAQPFLVNRTVNFRAKLELGTGC